MKSRDAASAVFAAISPSDITSAAIAFAATSKEVFVVLGSNFYVSRPDATAYELFSSGFGGIGDQPLLFDILVTTRERAIAERLSRCEALSSPSVIAVRVNSLIHDCAPLEGALSDLTWTHDPAVGLGAGTFGNGNVTFVFDNASVDYLE